MTRKDYGLIARVFRTRTVQGAPAPHGYVDGLNDAHKALAADNPRFDRARFLRACGVED